MLAPEAFIATWFRRVWHEGDASAIEEYMAPDAVIHGVGESVVHGAAGFRQMYDAYRATFSDIHFDVTDEAVADNRIGYYAVVTMTHRATGRTVRVPGGGVIRLRDGQIIEAHECWDFLTMLKEMGYLPPDALMQALTGTLLPYDAQTTREVRLEARM